MYNIGVPTMIIAIFVVLLFILFVIAPWLVGLLALVVATVGVPLLLGLVALFVVSVAWGIWRAISAPVPDFAGGPPSKKMKPCQHCKAEIHHSEYHCRHCGKLTR